MATAWTKAADVKQATELMPATSNSKDDRKTALNSRNANNSTSISRDANRVEMPETVWKPTTYKFSRKFAKNSSERRKIHERTIIRAKIVFSLSNRFQLVR
jgi:hypothetical protein